MQTHTHTHTYLRTCLNTSPFPRQASLVLTLWSCRLLVYWCKLAGRGPSEEQRAWQRRGWWVLLLPLHPSSSSSIHSHLYPPLPVKECFQLDSPGRKSQVISWTSEGLKLGLLVHLQKLLIKKNMRRVSFLSDPLRGWCHHIIKLLFFLLHLSCFPGILVVLSRNRRWERAHWDREPSAWPNNKSKQESVRWDLCCRCCCSQWWEPHTSPFPHLLTRTHCAVMYSSLHCVCVWMMNAAVYYCSYSVEIICNCSCRQIIFFYKKIICYNVNIFETRQQTFVDSFHRILSIHNQWVTGSDIAPPTGQLVQYWNSWNGAHSVIP